MPSSHRITSNTTCEHWEQACALGGLRLLTTPGSVGYSLIAQMPNPLAGFQSQMGTLSSWVSLQGDPKRQSQVFFFWWTQKCQKVQNPMIFMELMLGGFGILILFKTQPPPPPRHLNGWIVPFFLTTAKLPLVTKLSSSVRFDCVVNPVPVVGHLGVDSILAYLNWWTYSRSIRYLIYVCVCVNADDWHIAHLKCYTSNWLEF